MPLLSPLADSVCVLQDNTLPIRIAARAKRHGNVVHFILRQPAVLTALGIAERSRKDLKRHEVYSPWMDAWHTSVAPSQPVTLAPGEGLIYRRIGVASMTQLRQHVQQIVPQVRWQVTRVLCRPEVPPPPPPPSTSTVPAFLLQAQPVEALERLPARARDPYLTHNVIDLTAEEDDNTSLLAQIIARVNKDVGTKENPILLSDSEDA